MICERSLLTITPQRNPHGIYSVVCLWKTYSVVCLKNRYIATYIKYLKSFLFIKLPSPDQLTPKLVMEYRQNYIFPISSEPRRYWSMLATKILKCANITLILNSLILLFLLNEVVANLSPWDGIERLMFRVWSTSAMASSKVTYLWCYQSEPGPLQILIIPLKNNRQISFSVRQTPNISEKNMKPFVAFFLL